MCFYIRPSSVDIHKSGYRRLKQVRNVVYIVTIISNLYAMKILENISKPNKPPAIPFSVGTFL